MQQSGRRLATILVGLLLCGAFRAEAAGPAEEVIARGKALAVAGDCAGCHTADPAKPFAGGKRIDSRFGSIYSANLTPDRETGIRNWRDEDFLHALRHGVAPDGSRYYPAFPYPYFTKLIREDILAIRAYLGTLEPVRNTVPPPDLRFPFNFRVGMRVWNLLYFQPGILMPDQSKGGDWNRGRYLVEGLGHCGACHTPKNFLGADKANEALAGYGAAPRLDGRDGSAMKNWSVEEIIEYLRKGSNAKAKAGPVMSAIVTSSTSQMNEKDVQAMAIYLKSLAP